MKNAKEPVYSRSYGKEDLVKETLEGCLSRLIRKNLNCFESQISKQTGKNDFLTV